MMSPGNDVAKNYFGPKKEDSQKRFLVLRPRLTNDRKVGSLRKKAWTKRIDIGGTVLNLFGFDHQNIKSSP